MMKLMKYEFLRRKRLLISVLLVIVFLEAAIYTGLHLGGNWYIMSLAFFFILCVGGMLFPFIDVVSNYFSDFKNKNGYMLYLTPNTGGKIIGSKALFALIEVIAIMLILWGVVSLDLNLLSRLFPNNVKPLLAEAANGFQIAFNVDKVTFWTVSPMILIAIMQYFTNMMIAILSITIAKTVLSNKDFNWLFALVFYFGVAFAMQTVNAGALALFGFAGDMINVMKANSETMPHIMRYLMVGAGMYAIWSFASIFISSKLLNKRTDL
ncbi:MAG: hypothetical protein KAQ68_10155 [Clostridiales bacterium]|nr:hypothetical protein [Clostridiales bacterium]